MFSVCCYSHINPFPRLFFFRNQTFPCQCEIKDEIIVRKHVAGGKRKTRDGFCKMTMIVHDDIYDAREEYFVRHEQFCEYVNSLLALFGNDLSSAIAQARPLPAFYLINCPVFIIFRIIFSYNFSSLDDTELISC